jgi:hypothetical protein
VQGNVQIENASAWTQEIDIVKGRLQPLDVEVDGHIEESTHGVSRGGCSSSRVHRQGGEESSTGREDQDARVGVVGLKSHAQPSAVEEIFSGRQVAGLGSSSPFNRDKIASKAVQFVSTQVVTGDLCSTTISKRFVVSGTFGERFVVSGTFGERFVVSGTFGKRFVISGTFGERFVVSGAFGRRIWVADGFLVSFRLKVAPRAVFYGTVAIEDIEIQVSPVRTKRHFHRAHRRTFTRPEKEDEGFALVNLVLFVFGFFTGSQYFNSREVTAETLQAFHFSRPDETDDPREGCQARQEEGNDESRSSPQARSRAHGMPPQVFLPF